MRYTSFDGGGPVEVLSLLKSHSAQYLSGQDICDALKISRAAVGRHIRAIRRMGYAVRTRPGTGYRLTADTKRPLPWEVAAGLKTGYVGRRIYYFDSTSSTQDRALELAGSDGDENGSVVIAGRQTRGRGRRPQRRWESPEGGIWMSVLVVRPRLGAPALPLIPIAVSTALSGAIDRAAGVRTRLKWPNDVTIGSKKVAGTVIDAAVESGRLQYAAIGIGINLDIDVEGTEKRLEGTPNFYGITSVARHSRKKGADGRDLLRTLFAELEAAITQLEDGKTGQVIRRWTERSSTIGRRVSAVAGGDGRRISGTATGIDADGSLVVRTGNGLFERILAGDVSYLR